MSEEWSTILTCWTLIGLLFIREMFRMAKEDEKR